MRRLLAPAALIAVLALSGCAGSQQTTVEACEAVTSSWDEFEAFAQTEGRDEGEMVAMRDDMLVTWAEAVDSAPQWTSTAVGAAHDLMSDFAAGAGSEAVDLYRMTESQIDLLREQCRADGNL